VNTLRRARSGERRVVISLSTKGYKCLNIPARPSTQAPTKRPPPGWSPGSGLS